MSLDRKLTDIISCRTFSKIESFLLTMMKTILWSLIMRVHQTVAQKKIYADLTNQNVFLDPRIIIPEFNGRPVELLDSDEPKVKNTQESFEDILDAEALMQNLVSSPKHVSICNEISDTPIEEKEQLQDTSKVEDNSNATRNSYVRASVEGAGNVNLEEIDDQVINESPYIRWENLDINDYPWAPLEIHLAKQMESGTYVPGVPMPRLAPLLSDRDNWSISVSYRLFGSKRILKDPETCNDTIV